MFMSQSGKVYVGQSSQLKRRKYEHHRQLRKGQHVNKHLQSSFNKYGGLSYLVLEYLADTETLTEREQYWIDFFDSYHNGMNQTPFAATSTGCVRTDEQRAVIQKITQEFWSKEENRKAQSERKKKFYAENPGMLVRMSETTKGLLAENPERAIRHSEFMKERCSSEEYKREFSERMSKRWEGLTDEEKAQIVSNMHNISDEERRVANLKATATRFKAKKTRDNDPACFVGVHWQTSKTRTGTPRLDACARWHDPATGEDKLKRFSVAKYGLMPAFYMACKYRSEIQKQIEKYYDDLLATL